MRAALLAAVLALAGPVPVFLVSSATPGSPLTDPPAAERAVLDEAFGTWGLDYVLVGPGTAAQSYGAIQINLVELEPDAGVAGYHAPPVPCRRVIWSTFSGRMLAHELGHAWGLDHVEDADNLMHPRPPRGFDLTDEQLDDADAAIGLFLACVDGA